MTIFDFKTIPYDFNTIYLIDGNNNIINGFAGFLSIPAKYNDYRIIYISVKNDSLYIQVVKEC